VKPKDEFLKQENELLDQFKLRLSTNSLPLLFWKDGIIDYVSYQDSNPRLLYILKDANDDKSDDLRTFLKGVGQEYTWGVVARWNYAIFNGFPDWNTINGVNAEDMRRKWLKYSAMINLKKTPSSDKSDLLEVSTLCKDLLLKQIKLYEPNLIICCGTSWVVGKIFSEYLTERWKFSRNGVRFSRWRGTGSYVIEFVHPQARYHSHFKHFMLTEAVKELYNQKQPNSDF